MQKEQARRVLFCLRKNRTVPFDRKFSPGFPYKQAVNVLGRGAIY